MNEDGDATGSTIVISGAGLAASLGTDRREVWSQLCAGASGLRTLTALEQTPIESKSGGQALDLPADFLPHLPREARYLRLAIDQAFTEAKAADALPYPSHRVGLVFGTTLHGMRAAGRFLRQGSHEPLRQFLAPAVLDLAAGDRGCHGAAITTCSACSSGLAAVGLAMLLLRSGEFDMIVCGGYDPISEYAYAGFNSLRLIAAGPLRPFCRDREGMKLGEGYAALVLEREGDARRRGIEPLARVLGYGESADAHHLTQPHPEGDGAARAMQAALANAGLTSRDVDLISAHATGTPDNDRGEHAALKRVYGERLRDVPVAAFKSHLGHTLGGAGAVELVLSMMALTTGMVPPTAGASPAELEFDDMQVASTARPARLRATVNTSIGFGGANASVVLGTPLPPGEGQGEGRPSVEVSLPNVDGRSTLPQPLPKWEGSARRDVVISGIGVVLSGAVGNDAFVRRLNDLHAAPIVQDEPAIEDDQLAALVNARRVRRLSPYVKLSLAATSEAFRDAGIADAPAFAATCSAILGTAHGSAGYSGDYYREIVEKGIEAANPMLFAEGVPNAAAAHVSMAFGIKGGCQTIIGSRTAGLDALRLASLRIATGEWDRVIVSAAEEQALLVNESYGHCGLYHAGRGAGLPFEEGNGFATGCGAVTIVLESRDSLRERGAEGRALVTGGASASSSLENGPRELIEQGRRVMSSLGHVGHVVCSANGTSLDRMELAALDGIGASITSLSGHFAETFSVTPLAGLAAVLLAGRLPRMFGGSTRLPDRLRAAGGNEERPARFTVMCSDYRGLLTAMSFSAVR